MDDEGLTRICEVSQQARAETPCKYAYAAELSPALPPKDNTDPCGMTTKETTATTTAAAA